VPVFIYCPTCETRFDVTDCGDSVRFLCDACGTEVLVRFANLVQMPGGIAAEVKEMGDGSRWLVCPKCGLSADITRGTPGNRFRCRRCNLLLQVPGAVSSAPPLQTRKGEDILRCSGCKTRYDISRYSTGNRFRCRRCGLTLLVPPRGAWKRTGEWEIDVEKSLVKCNRCNQSYPLDAHAMEGAFVCKKCRRVFSGLRELVETGPAASAPDEEWEIDVENGQIVCPGCRYGYDLTGHPPGTDFVCRHCGRVFRMPKEIPADERMEKREKIACPKCGATYDVSGYLRGTMFSCDRCQEVLQMGGATVTVSVRDREVAEPPAARVDRKSDRLPAAAAKREEAKTPDAAPAPAPAAATRVESSGAIAPRLSVPEPLEPSPAPEPAPVAETAAPAAEPAPRVLPWEERTVELEPQPAESAAEAGAPQPGPETPAPEPTPAPEAASPEPPAPEPAEPAEPAEPPVSAPAPEPAPAPAPPEAAAPKKVPVPFPPTPPEMIPGGEKPKKPAVALVVKCTVCGTKHDASGKAPGDKILCKCGKHIRIKGPKKGEAPAAPAADPGKKKSAQEEDIEVLMKRKTVRSEDVEVIKSDKPDKKKK
jgi:DNA-directed RNA polymerase subunit RPC12/RpoP